MSKCPKCGNEVSTDANYCIFCGSNLNSLKNEIMQLKGTNTIHQEPQIDKIEIPSYQHLEEVEIQNGSGNPITTKTPGFWNKIKGAVKDSSRNIAYAVLLRNHNNHIAKMIISQFNFKELKNMCLYFNIGSPHPMGYNNKDELVFFTPTYDDWKKYAFKHIELADLKDYAKKKGKLSYEITELEKRYKEERLKKYPQIEKDDSIALSISSSAHYDDKLLRELIKAIEEFRPVKYFKNEDLYHTNLYTYLCEKIPVEIAFEEQRGRSRPDITVGDIAIEVKGPTGKQALITIADKINRYSQHYDYIIVVLFDVEVYEKFYQEWYENIVRQYEDQVTIIRNDGHFIGKSTNAGESTNNHSSVRSKVNVGYCIRCRLEISRNPDKPLCSECYEIWSKYSNTRFPEKYCHICGAKSKQSYSKPVCYTCYKKMCNLVTRYIIGQKR